MGLPVTSRRKVGMSQVSMAFMSRATHVLQWTVQREARPRGGANPQNRSQFGLQAAIRLHEAGIASNRGSATSR